MKLIETPSETARRDLKLNARRFKKKRKTTLIRVQTKWHVRLKKKAKEEKRTMSQLNDDVYKFYFKNGDG